MVIKHVIRLSFPVGRLRVAKNITAYSHNVHMVYTGYTSRILSKAPAGSVDCPQKMQTGRGGSHQAV